MIPSIYLDSLMESTYRYLTKIEGVNDIALVGTRVRKSIIKFYRNSLSSIDNIDTSFLKFLIGYKRRRLVTTINTINEDQIKSHIESLLMAAENIPELEDYVPLPKGYTDYIEPRGIYDAESLSIENAVETLDNLFSELLNQSSVERVAGTYELIGVKRTLKTSGGRYGEYSKSIVRLNIRCFLERGLTYQISRIGVKVKDLKLDEIPEHISEITSAMGSKGRVTPGKYNIVISPLVSANLLGYYTRFSSAYYVDIGLSPFIDKIGELVASEELTVYDDPTLDETPVAKPFDNEGTPTSRTIVIDKGRLKTYLHNIYTAKKYGVKSTGHAGYIVPEPHSVIVNPGNSSLNDLLEDIGNGLLITNVWYTRFQNYRIGDFSTLPRDLIFIIKNGDIHAYTYNIRISDNLVNMFKNIISISKDVQWVYWWDTPYISRTPYIAIKEVGITVV